MRCRESLRWWQGLREGKSQMDTLRGEAKGKSSERGKQIIQNTAKSMAYIFVFWCCFGLGPLVSIKGKLDISDMLHHPTPVADFTNSLNSLQLDSKILWKSCASQEEWRML